MRILQNVSLKPYNTFGIDVPAEQFLELEDTAQLPDILNDNTLPASKHIIGGGSNILLTKTVSGLVILNKSRGINKIKRTMTTYGLKSGREKYGMNL